MKSIQPTGRSRYVSLLAVGIPLAATFAAAIALTAIELISWAAADQNASTRPATLPSASSQALVLFDHERGLYLKPFDLTLSTSPPGASIRYTIDGSMPTATVGTPYAGPIPIGVTTVVHAAAFFEAVPAAPVAVASFIFPAQVLQQPAQIAGYVNPSEPITNPGPHAVNVPLSYAMNPKITADPARARQALDGLSQIPTVSIGVDRGNIFGPGGFYDSPRGPDSQKHPISFEFIDPKNPAANVGVIAGISGHSKQKLKRSFHIHFKAKYGGPAKLKAAIFATAPFGADSAATEFDDLILRGGNNRSWATTGWPSKTTYTEDEFVRDTQIAMTGQGVHGTFVHLYLNGIYWGLYNLVERPSDGFGRAYFGAAKGDYFSVSQKGVESGDDTRWNELLNTVCRKDMSVRANYDQLCQYLDVKQFADYLIGQWFCGVSDWPDTNYWAGGDMARNQPLRFFSWDGEEMINTVNRFPTVPHGPWVNPAFAKTPVKRSGPIIKLWNAVKHSPDFMALLAGEVRRNTAPGGALSDAAVLARWTALNASIDSAIVDESARWGDATASTGRPTYTKENAWNAAVAEIARDLDHADAKFIASLRAEGYYP